MHARISSAGIVTGAVLMLVSAASAGPTGRSQNGFSFAQEQQRIRYGLVSPLMQSDDPSAMLQEFDEQGVSGSSTAPKLKLKSPGKAFAMSLLVPGLGQWYAGDRIKPFVFLGVEAAAWFMHFGYVSDGDDLTSEYELFNRTYWSRDDYEQKYLLWVYGVTDDDEAPPEAGEVSHHLPDTRTQQYYEMTGKYDQFAWGWADADLGGNGLDDFSGSNPPPAVVPGSVPQSTLRNRYEIMRDDANKKFDSATKMIYVSLANRVVSAFEALLSVKAKNRKARAADDAFSNITVRAKLKSMYSKRDTPWVTVTYHF